MRLPVIIAVVASCAHCWAQSPSQPLGLDACADASLLCYPPACAIAMAGTTAMEGEGQDYKLLAPGETATILTIEGPAIIHRIWSTSQHTDETRLALKADGKEFALWGNRTLPDGDEAGPLRAMDGQAYWSYEPIAVREHAEFIATDLREPPEGDAQAEATDANGNKFYLQVAYSESGGDAAPGLAEEVAALLVEIANDPVDDLETSSLAETVTVSEGSPVQVSGDGKTVVVIMVIHVGNATFEQLKGTRIVMKSDGAPEPCVDVPIPYLFCAYWDLAEYAGAFTAIKGKKLVCRFPIPIGKGLEIGLAKFGRAESLDSVKITLLTGQVHAPEPPYRFCAAYSEIISEKGEPLHLADIKGEGVFIGCTFAADGLHHRKFAFLEGNEQLYVDGEAKPSWEGTGTEDFFNGAWYFSAGVKARAFHGLTYLNEEPPPRMSAYRYLISDRIGFRKSLRFDMQHGSRNSVPETLYKCVSLWYQKPPCKVAEPAEAEIPEGGPLGLGEVEEEGGAFDVDMTTPIILVVIILLAVVAGVKYRARRMR